MRPQRVPPHCAQVGQLRGRPDILLVDRQDSPVGVASLLDCHRFPTGRAPQAGLLPLHRAFSLFLRARDTGRLLLQRRAPGKLTFPGLWANTCCSHPRVVDGRVEPCDAAAVRRAREELGLRLHQGSLALGGRVLYSAASCETYGEHERKGPRGPAIFNARLQWTT